MKKRITESQLRDIIAESVKKCISELNGYHPAPNTDKNAWRGQKIGDGGIDLPKRDVAAKRTPNQKYSSNSDIKRKVNESVKAVLREFIAGGTDWGNTYRDYRQKNYETAGNDEVVQELHTICQYCDDLYNAVYNHQPSRYFTKCKPEYLEQAYQFIEPIYSLMANRTNRAGDAHAITIEEIKQECLPSLRRLAQMEYLGVVCQAAKRACQNLQSY